MILTNSCVSYEFKDLDATINAHKLYQHVQRLVRIDPPRNFQNVASLNEAASYIFETFKNIGLSVEYQIYSVSGVEYKNVIASYGPLDGKRLVIGAHYDVFSEFQGADDNASGIAALLELARLLGDRQPKLKYRVELVAFTLEEPPFFRSEAMGSYIHAKSLREAKADIIGMISIEMIGYFSSHEDSQAYPLGAMSWFYPTVGDYIAIVSNYSSATMYHFFAAGIATKIKTESIRAPSFLVGVDFSDHLNYWRFDYPAIMITDTSFYRNPNYHEQGDTIDTLDFSKMAAVVEGIFIGIINFPLSET